MPDPDPLPELAADDPDLAELATAHGVAVTYRDATDRDARVSRATVVAVLGALDVEAGSTESVRAALERARARGASSHLPPTVVAAGARGLPGPGRLTLEDGTERELAAELPGDLPVGYHRLVVDGRDTTVLVPPGPLAPPPRTWGWMLQLYSLRSAGSWGCGDLADLGEVLRRAAGEHGAGAVLCNPLHALALAPRVEPSPYSPSSRRVLHPLYLRVADTAAYRAAPAAVRAQVDALAPASDELIDYDAVWAAKSAALELLVPHDPSGLPAPGDLDPELRDVATWYALAERHGSAWRSWPETLRSPDAPGVADARAELAARVGFHAWCQRLADEQLAAARAAGAGMALGLIADLAVGCSAEGADAWALQSALADGVTVGAPPDDFNQQGQDWSLPPWRPDALAASGYAPLRSMIRAVLRHADGIRIDHVAGLWRLWWIPPGCSAREGTYVAYDAEAMLAVLAIEAHRAGAVVVGEDLGTVEARVTEGLAEHGMLGCAVLWFQRTGSGELRAPQDWHPQTLATVSTHDLPTATGFLHDEHVRARDAAGLLDDPDAAAAQAERERAELMRLLVEQGLLGSSRPHGDDEVVLALHELLGRAGSRVALAAFTDVVGEDRQPNLPGTVEVYPNWRIPLPLGLEDLLGDPRVLAVARALRDRA